MFSVAKASLCNLAVCEEAYLDAIGTPEANRSLRAIVVIQTYRQFEQLSSQISALKSELSQLKADRTESLATIAQVRVFWRPIQVVVVDDRSSRTSKLARGKPSTQGKMSC